MLEHSSGSRLVNVCLEMSALGLGRVKALRRKETASVSAGECGAVSSIVVAMGHPDRNSQSSIQPAMTSTYALTNVLGCLWRSAR